VGAALAFSLARANNQDFVKPLFAAASGEEGGSRIWRIVVKYRLAEF
jgi:hypothetical protein